MSKRSIRKVRHLVGDIFFYVKLWRQMRSKMTPWQHVGFRDYVREQKP